MPSQKLSLQQKLLQKLSPQQIQVIKLLEIPTIQLEQRIKKEIEENKTRIKTNIKKHVDFEIIVEYISNQLALKEVKHLY